MTPQELRDSIIRLAMQGKLVEQRTEEGTAETLKETIDKDRKQKIRNKTAKENKKVEPITEDALPFDIPDSWEWIRFGELVSYNMGKTPPRAEAQWWGNDVPWVSIADMPESGHITQTKESVSIDAISGKFSEKISKAGTLLMSFKLTVGRVSILDIDAVHNEAIISIYPYADYDRTIQHYLFLLLPYISQLGESKNAIKGKTLNDTSISNLLIPLPPLAEQKRIVAKIEELLPYIDRYEKAWSKLEDFNKRFPVDMQKSILQMAIQGKLVERRPEEGTGEELYQQIQAEKQKLIKEGKIKKEKPLPKISEDEIPFEIPENWRWVRWGDLSQSIQYGYNAPAQDVGRIKMVRISDIRDGKILWETVPYCEIREEEISTYLLQKNDIFFARTGGTVGKSLLVKDVPEESIYAGYLIRTRYSSLLCPEYMKYFMESQLYWNQLRNGTIATAQPNCNGKTLSKMVLPLPPLSEQKRIVAKLEEILPLCERLK